MRSATNEEFATLANRSGISRARALEIWELLASAYGETTRHYHTLEHLEMMLSHLSDGTEGADDVAWAIWFHDVVYDPRSSTNEDDSVTLMVKHLGHVLALKRVRSIQKLIEATDPRRVAEPNASDKEKLIRDLDLLILGAATKEYESYTTAIRREYAFVPDADYRKGREEVMNRFLDRPYIYLTDRFAKLERQARENIQNEIAQLRNVPAAGYPPSHSQ